MPLADLLGSKPLCHSHHHVRQPQDADRRAKTVLPASELIKINLKSCELHGGEAQTDSELQSPEANTFKNSQSKQDTVWRGKEACTFSAVFGRQRGYRHVDPDHLRYTSSLLWQCPVNRAGINSSLERGGKDCPQVGALH